MYVQYVGRQKKGSGYHLTLMEEIDPEKGFGSTPILVRGKFGLELPYVTQKIFDDKLSKVEIGDFVNGEFNRYGNFIIS